MQEPYIFFTRKRIFQLLFILVSFLIIVTIYIIIVRWGKERVTITTIPNDSTVYIDGKKEDSREVYLKKGSHSFRVSRDLFESYKKDIDVGKQNNVILLPIASSNEALTWLSNNPKVQKQREIVASQENQQLSKIILRKYPLIERLPIIYDHGESFIGSGPSTLKDGETSIIVHDISTSGRGLSVELIKKMGYKPGDYIIEFPDFINPLINEGE